MSSQRDIMRRCWLRYRSLGEAAVVDAYAKAEMEGEVARHRNSNKRSSLQYARALLNDGLKKGWLPDDTRKDSSGGPSVVHRRKGTECVSSVDHPQTLSVPELLLLHSEILEELRTRGVLRSANNPTGDLAEYLFCSAFGWAQESNSTKAFDATDVRGRKIQIKGRRIHSRNKSRQLSAIRDLDGFDILAAVLFDERYRVMRAALVPVEVVRNHSSYIQHTNSNKFILGDVIWSEPGVIDVTDQLRSFEG